MDEASLLSQLATQGPVFALMGYIIYWLKARLEKRETELSEFSNEVIKLTAIYQAKFEEDHKKLERILDMLEELIKNKRS